MTPHDLDPKARAQIARDVQAFYDAHPYPPPVEHLDDHRRLGADPDRRRADHHLHWPCRPYAEGQALLVAGCGTSQAAKLALRQPDARVVGIDISASSLRKTEALKRKYGLDNLEIRQLPIEQADELDERFDRVVCSGVLHHLADPAAGLEALRRVLAPDGAMELMVYARYGRTGIYMLQDYCTRLAIGTSRQEIQELAETLMALPRGHPLAPLLAEAPDFRTPAGLADALLNPHDRAFTVPELLALIDGADLRFGRWVRQAPYMPACGAVARSPHHARLRQLPEAEQYAAMELFRGTMVRHSVIVHRSDGSGDERIRFDDDRWPGFVPIRLPTTICVEERTPPGAAAVLINQAHSDPDLVLPVDGPEKQLFDGIDGRRSIREILRGATGSESNPEERHRARDFFQRLWWWDQVVFDASSE